MTTAMFVIVTILLSHNLSLNITLKLEDTRGAGTTSTLQATGDHLQFLVGFSL